MKIFIDFIYSFIVSFEFIIIVISIIIDIYFDVRINNIAVLLFKDIELLKSVALLPLILLSFTVVREKTLLFPNKNKNNVLQKWADFYLLKNRYYVALIYLVICSFVGFVLYLLKDNIEQHLFLVILIDVISISFIATSSVFMASIKVRELLLKHS